MPQLRDVKLGVEANRRLTIEHADQILKMWPSVRTLYGFLEDCTEFARYLKPKINIYETRHG